MIIEVHIRIWLEEKRQYNIYRSKEMWRHHVRNIMRSKNVHKKGEKDPLLDRWHLFSVDLTIQLSIRLLTFRSPAYTWDVIHYLSPLLRTCKIWTAWSNDVHYFNSQCIDAFILVTTLARWESQRSFHAAALQCLAGLWSRPSISDSIQLESAGTSQEFCPHTIEFGARIHSQPYRLKISRRIILSLMSLF